MISYGIALSWMVISPLAFITDVLAILIIVHYFPFFHGTDVTLMSLLFAMAGNVAVVLPMPAYLEITQTKWTPNLCTGYVWCCLTFRVSQIFSLSILTIHWSTMLKLSAEKKKYFSTKYLKISVIFVWIFSAIVGLLPVIGAVDAEYNSQNTCKFLGFNLGTGFGLFFIIANIAAMFVSVICAADATFLIKHMKSVAKTKYQAGRFHIPDKRADVPSQGASSITERYHRLNFAWDLSKFVLIFTILSFLINHLPYAVIQGLQVFRKTDRGVLEVVSLYLIGLEALLLPQTLWCLSRRYKHALTYQWKVHVLRRTDVEEDDPYSCMLQSYARERDKASSVPSRPVSSLSRAGGYSASGTIRSNASDYLGKYSAQNNGKILVNSVSGEVMRAENTLPRSSRHMNGIVNGEVHVENHVYNERAIDTTELDIPVAQPKPRPLSQDADTLRRVSEASSSTSSQTSNKGTSQTLRPDIKRSSSCVSRKDWKDHMRKKHLPPIFINEGFDSGDPRAVAARKLEENKSPPIPTIYKGGGRELSGGALHYYMSSDYHPDYLTDSLPRHRLAQVLDNESDGISEMYQDNDIGDVLDKDSEGSGEHSGSYMMRDSFRFQNTHEVRKPYLSTFKSPLSFETNGNINAKKGDYSVKSAYGTYEDLSHSGMKCESEIVLDSEELSLEDLSDGYHSFKGMKRLSHKSDEKDTQLSKFLAFASERTNGRSTPVSSPDFRSLGRNRNSDPFKSMRDFEMTSTSFGTRNGFERPKRVTDSMSTSPEDFRNGMTTVTATPMFTTFTTPVSVPQNTHLQPNSNEYQHRSDKTTATFHPEQQSTPDVISNTQGSNVDIHVNNKISIDDENESSGSNSSVTLSPYKGETRRKPWMDDVDIQEEENKQMAEPLVIESDTETLMNSNDSNDRYSFGFELRNARSNVSTPVSSIFDEETDRGFEEALEAHSATGANVYGGVGLCFESIKEEPEDLTSSGGSNPFLSNTEEEFRTQAVVSRNSRSDSRTSSNASISDNPVSSSPNRSPLRGKFLPSGKVTPIIVTTDMDAEYGDSGFASGLDKNNTSSDSSSHQDSVTRGRHSPWPDEDVATDGVMSFESNFCETNKTAENQNCPNKPSRSLHNNSKYNSTLGTFKLKDQTRVLLDSKKPANKAVKDIRSHTRNPPVRVKSLDGASPIPARKPPRRGSSFDGIKQDIKPAYF